MVRVTTTYIFVMGKNSPNTRHCAFKIKCFSKLTTFFCTIVFKNLEKTKFMILYQERTMVYHLVIPYMFVKIETIALYFFVIRIYFYNKFIPDV